MKLTLEQVARWSAAEIVAGADSTTATGYSIDSRTIAAGELFFAVRGERLDGLPERRLAAWRARHVGFVFQFYNLLPMLTAEENIKLPLSVAGRQVDEAWFAELTTKVGLAGRLAGRLIDGYPHQQLLRGGRVIQVAAAGRVADPVDAGLRGPQRGHRVKPHSRMLQPHPRCGLAAVFRQIDAPDQPGQAVCEEHDAGRDQAAAVEAADRLGVGEHGLRVYRRPRAPVAQVEPDQA